VRYEIMKENAKRGFLSGPVLGCAYYLYILKLVGHTTPMPWAHCPLKNVKQQRHCFCHPNPVR
jgi:hypothetical protein